MSYKTIKPQQEFTSKEEWMQAIGIKPNYLACGKNLMVDVHMDEWIRINRFEKGIPVLTPTIFRETIKKQHNK